MFKGWVVFYGKLHSRLHAHCWLEHDDERHPTSEPFNSLYVQYQSPRPWRKPLRSGVLDATGVNQMRPVRSGLGSDRGSEPDTMNLTHTII